MHAGSITHAQSFIFFIFFPPFTFHTFQTSGIPLLQLLKT